VLNTPLPKEPPNLEEIYARRYTEAWKRWINELALRSVNSKKDSELRKDVAVDSLGEVIHDLDVLIREAHPALPQVVQTVGRGRDALQSGSTLRKGGKQPFYAGCGKRFGRSVDRVSNAWEDIKTPRECSSALEIFTPLNQLSAKDKPAEEDGESSTREDYQKYLAAAKTLRTTLHRIKESTERNSEALKLVQATMSTTGDLWGLDAARTELMASLDSRLSESGFDLNNSGLNGALRDIEGLAWQALLPLAARALNEQWKNVVYIKWKTLKDNEPRLALLDEDRCKGRTGFLREELGKGFIDKSLAVFYVGNNILQCSLKHMAPPFDHQLKLLPNACPQLRTAREIGEQTVDCTKVMGPSGGGAKRDIKKADVKPPPIKDCAWPASEAILDRGDKLFSCQQSTGNCTSSDATSQRAQLKIRWKEHEDVTVYDFDDYEQLKKQAHFDNSNGMLFDIPVNKTSRQVKNCKGYVVRFELAPAGGGGPMPKTPDNRWKNVDLPPSLL
jgi:hypothetical protein